jgi:hypothetical protein
MQLPMQQVCRLSHQGIHASISTTHVVSTVSSWWTHRIASPTPHIIPSPCNATNQRHQLSALPEPQLHKATTYAFSTTKMRLLHAAMCTKALKQSKWACQYNKLCN